MKPSETVKGKIVLSTDSTGIKQIPCAVCWGKALHNAKWWYELNTEWNVLVPVVWASLCSKCFDEYITKNEVWEHCR